MGFGRGITFSNVSFTCPRCGGTAAVQDGTYDFVGGFVAAFTAPGMTRKKVEAARDLAEKVASNDLSPIEAADQADTIKTGLGNFFRIAHDRGITFDRILALILGFLAFWSEFAPDEDAEALREAAQMQNELSQRMIEELRKLNEADDN